MEHNLVPVYIAVVLLFIVLWIWALLDLAFSTFKKNNWKVAWLLIIVFFPIVGSGLYLLLRKEFKAQKRRGFKPDFNVKNQV